MLTGALSTLVLKEGKRLTLEEMSNERQEEFILGMSGPLQGMHLCELMWYCAGKAYDEGEDQAETGKEQGHMFDQ